MIGWRLALRTARREARRAKGRSALAIALIALPVTGLTFAAVTYDMFRLTPAERVEREIGSADAQLWWQHDGPIRQTDAFGFQIPSGGRVSDRTPGSADVAALLPPGSRVTAWRDGQAWVETVGGVGQLRWHAVDLTDPITAGLARIVAGQPPAPGEVALTAAATGRLGLAVGDALELDGRSYPVVGKVEFPGIPGPSNEQVPGMTDQVLLFHPDHHPGAGSLRWLVATPQPVTWGDVWELNRQGVAVYSRALALDPGQRAGAALGPEGETFQLGLVVAGLAAIEIVLLAGPAFAVGARRRQRDLALIAASGGTPAQLRRVVLAEGVVAGLTAAAGGLALGVFGALVTRDIAAQIFGALPGGYRFFPAALAGIVGFAVATGLLAALVPAFTAARQQVVEALAGRRGSRGFRRRWLLTGAVTAGLGAAVAGFGAWHTSELPLVAGLVLSQLGLALCTPALIGLVARLGGRLPLPARIALRDTARNRSSAAPAIAAVMAAVAGAVTVGVIIVSEQEQGAATWAPAYPPGRVTAGVHEGFDDVPPVETAAVARAARQTLPVAEVHPVGRPRCPEEDRKETGCLVVLLVPAERRCPYLAWDEAEPLDWSVPPLSIEQRRAASRDPRCERYHTPVGHSIAVDDGPALAAITGATGPVLTEAVAALRDRDAVVVTNPRYLSDTGEVTLALVRGGPDGRTTIRQIDLPGHLLRGGGLSQTDAVAPAAALRAAGLDVTPERLVMTTTRLPSQPEEDAFAAALQRLGTWGTVWRDPPRGTESVLLVLGLTVGLIALGAAGIATGLAAADRRADLSTLGAVGASPGIRRGMSLSQSGVIAGVGTLVGLAAGLGSSVTVLTALNQRYASTWPGPEPIPITVPWPHLAGLLAVPAVAMLGAGLLTRSRLPVERRVT